MARMGYDSSLEAEIQALWFGIELVEKMKIQKICVETDSSEVVRLLQGQRKDHAMKNLCDTIEMKMKTLLAWRINHIYKKPESGSGFPFLFSSVRTRYVWMLFFI